MALAVTLLVVGCVETKDEYTLNPDGTGKVKHEAVFPPVILQMGVSKPPEEKLQEIARLELENAQGVEAWRDVKFSRDAEGKVRFSGTAYFRDLVELQFYNNDSDANFFAPVWKNGVLELLPRKENEKKSHTKPPKTNTELKRAKAWAHGQYEQDRPTLVGRLSTMKADASFHLPGVVTGSNNFQRDPNGTLHLAYTGAKFIEIMDKFMADDAKLTAQLKAGRDVLQVGPEMDLEVNQQLFGEAKPVRATVATGAKPQFEISAEVAAAKKEMPALVKSVASAVPTPVVKAKGGALKSVSVGGVRQGRVYDKTDPHTHWLDTNEGYTLLVIAEFPSPVLKISECELEKAVAENGTDLLPENGRERNIYYTPLSMDKTVAKFDVKLATPPDGVKGVKEISGHITYLVGGKAKKVDAGFTELAAGAEGKAGKGALAWTGLKSSFGGEPKVRLLREQWNLTRKMFDENVSE